LLHQKSSATEKATLALQLQELYSSNLSSDNIQALIQSNYAKVKGYTDLSRLVNAAYVFLVILLGDIAAFTLQFETAKSHVQTDYYHYEVQFQLDPLFGVKFIQKLDRTFQLFLSKCMDRPTLQQVGPSACNLSGFIDDVENSTFIGSLPPALTQQSPVITPSPKKDQRKPSDSRSVTNDSKKPEWIIDEKLRISEVFSKEALKEIPDFKPGMSCCARYASKGHCFTNCPMAESHCVWPKAVQSQCHSWQSKHRHA